MGIGASIKSLFGGGGSAKPASIKKLLRARSASDRAWMAVRAAGRAVPGLLTESVDAERLRVAIGCLIAVPASLRAPDDHATARLVRILYDRHWNGDHDESGAVETSLAFLTSILADPKPPCDPAKEAIDFATIGLVEHLVKKASAEPDWSKIKIFEPIVEAPLRTDLAREGALDAVALWGNDPIPDGLDADWNRLLAELNDHPSWVASLQALRIGQPLSAENERLALDSLGAMLDKLDGR